MGRPSYEEMEYRGWRYKVVVIPAPENRWTFTADFVRAAGDTERTGRDHRTYITWDEAAGRGDEFARNWIDQSTDESTHSAQGLSTASRLTDALRAGHRFDYDLSYDPRHCGCQSCRRGDVIMAELTQPATREATERLLAQAREYREHLIVTFDAACRRRSAEDGARARAICGRLSDELGVRLVDQVRAMVIRDYGDHHGQCSWCAAKDGWFEQISSSSTQ